MSLVCDPPSGAMSASPQKLPASNITCRYWATSGTCFFGDQCNFAHNSAVRAATGKSVPKREKACKELLLTGYCKNEKNGCEYNHDISGVTRSGPPSASSTTTATVPSPVSLSSWTTSTSRVVTTASLSPGTTAAVRNKRLPVSAPAFVPAAVAAAQRASLSAWGGVTPGNGKLITGSTSQASDTAPASVPTSPTQNGLLTTSSSQTSVVDTPTTAALAVQVQDSEVSVNLNTLPTGTFVSSSILNASILNAQPFVPSSALANSGSSNGNTLTNSGSTQGPSIGGANAASFVPSGGLVASAVSAAPFVPKSKLHLLAAGTTAGGPLSQGRPLPPAGQSVMAMGGPASQQLQIRQQLSQLQQQMQQQAAAQAQVQAQAQAHMLAAAARSIGGNVMSSSQYMAMDVPMGIPPFRLPDGDDPALGMTAMSPPSPFLARVAGNGGLSVLPTPDALGSMGMVGDGTGGLQVGSSSPFSHNYGRGLPSPSSVRTQQLHQHMQKLQLQQQHQSFSGTPPFSLRPPQKTGPQTPEKQQQQQQQLNPQSEHPGLTGQSPPFSMRLPQKAGAQTPEKAQLLGSQVEVSAKVESRSSFSSAKVISCDKQGQESVLSSPERRDSDQPSVLPSEAMGAPQSPQQAGQIQSPQQQSTSVQQSILRQQQQQQQVQLQQQMHLQAQQQLRQKLQQQQQHLELLHQHTSQGQRTLSGAGHSQQRLPSSSYMRSSSPVSGVGPVAAATHGGATYFLGPGQGISSLVHAFSSPGGRNELRIVRGQSPAGSVPFGSRFLPDQLREELRRRQSLIHAQLDPEQDIVDLPEMLQRFHSLFPLEDVNREDEVPSTSFGVRTMVFKGVSSSDGQAYAIRRIDSRQVIPTAELAATAIEAVERWAGLARHPHIVAIRESFVSREVEDTAALFFVHDYYPGAITLQAMHLQQEQAGGVVHLTVNEEQLWSYMVQLATVLRVVHGAGLFFRPGGLHPSKIIVPSKGRLRVSGVGILDVLHGDPADDPRIFQREDLAGFGRLILTLACGSAANASLEFMASHYSADLVRITQALLGSSLEKSDGVGISSIRQLYAVLAERMFGEIENLHMQNDDAMNELSKETENGRLLRILVKLGMMNERPESDMDPGWSETGDRYLLKLFRDFIFHQTSEEGTPLIDWGHVIECLNKLDAGVPEKLILLSRDERSMLIASYADLKRCLESVYQELLVRASGDKARPTLPQNILIHSQSHVARLSQRQSA